MILDNEFLDAIANDCLILLTRALLGKTVSVFGVDGNGLYGSDYLGHTYKVVDLKVVVHVDTDENDPQGTAYIRLEGYDYTDYGHAATDENLKISLNQHFASEIVNPDMWSWAPLAKQGPDYVAITVDVNKLLDW